MSTFDTSVLVPLFLRGHPRAGDAARAFAEAEDVILEPSVVAEFATVFRRILKDAGKDGNVETRRALGQLLAEPRVRVAADVDHDAAVRLYLADTALSFTDAVVACSEEPVAFDDRIWRARAQGRT